MAGEREEYMWREREKEEEMREIVKDREGMRETNGGKNM